jgi:uncharacterized RDD family membrane protein YckC
VADSGDGDSFVRSAPAGWYPDPGAGPWWRYWDGAAWTHHVAPQTRGRDEAALPFAARRAEFGRRALGLLVDVVLVSVPTTALFFGVFIAWAASNSDAGRDPNLASFFAVLLPVQGIAFVAPLLYNGLLVANGRRTVGQRLIGLRVVDATTGQVISVGRGLLRALIAGIGSGQIMGLGYWWALWDQEHRTWHDMAAATVVIDTRDNVTRDNVSGR